MHLRTDLVQGSIRKTATEKLEINTRLKNKTWTNPQIKNHKNIHEIRLIRQQSRHKNPQHMYSGTSIYRFSRGWRKQTMNVGKRSIRETITHCKIHGAFKF